MILGPKKYFGLSPKMLNCSRNKEGSSVELNEKEAKVFLDDLLNPKPNPARDELMKKARQLNIEIR